MITRLALALDRALQRYRAEQCQRAASGAATFLPEARVHNFQDVPEAIQLGAGTHIRGELLVFPYGGRITMGQHCYLGEGSRIWSDHEVEIGDHVLIAHHVTITDTDGHELGAHERAASFQKLIQGGHPRTRPNVGGAPVRIGSYAWINHQSCILKGVTIGEGAVVGCGSVVTKDVPPYTLVAGNPAKPLRELPR